MGWVVNATLRPLYPLYRRLGGPQDRSGRVRKILPPQRDSIPDRQTRSESQYRLRYAGPRPANDYMMKFSWKITLLRSSPFPRGDGFVRVQIPAESDGGQPRKLSELCPPCAAHISDLLITDWSREFLCRVSVSWMQGLVKHLVFRSDCVSVWNKLVAQKIDLSLRFCRLQWRHCAAGQE